MRRLALSLLVVGCVAVLLGGAASARTHAPTYRHVVVILFVNGWGSVRPAKGFSGNRLRTCTKPHCGSILHAHRRRVTLVATPYPGWRLAGWIRGCKGDRTRRCSMDLSKFPCPFFVSYPPGATPCHGPKPYAWPKFVPAAPGLSRGNPIPIGTAKAVSGDYTVRVDAAQANVQLSPAPPAGQEYVDADLTLTYTGAGTSTPVDQLDLNARGRLKQLYNADHGGGCPASALQSRLDITDPLASGQSTRGHVCWTIKTGDAASLEMFFGSGNLDFPGTTWFALH